MSKSGHITCEIDQTALQSVRQLQRPGQANVVLRLIDAYLASAPSLVDELRRAIESSNVTTAQRSAHTLKSSSAVLGASELAKACRKIEAYARENNLTQAGIVMPNFEQLYQATCSALLNLRQQETLMQPPPATASSRLNSIHTR